MDFTEDFGKKVREDEQAARAVEEPQRIPLGDVLRDEHMSRLLASYLEQGAFEDTEENDGEEDPARIRLDKKSLGEKIYKGEPLSEADVDALHEETGKFFEFKERADAVRARIEANKEALIHASPKLREIVELAGAGTFDSAIVSRFDEIAFAHPDILENLEDTLVGLDRAEASTAVGNERIAALCKEYRVTEDEYKAALRRREDGDPFALEDLVKSKRTRMERIMGKFNFRSKQDPVSILAEDPDRKFFEEDFDRRSYIREKLAETNESLAEMGTILRGALFTDQEAKGILEGSLERKPNPEKKLTFDEAREMFSIPLDKDEVVREWQTYQQDNANLPGYDVERARKTFSQEYAKKKTPKKKGGFWATVFNAFLSSGIEGMTR